MATLTQSEFTIIARNKAGSLNLSDSRMFSKASAITSVFLSHSHYDKMLVKYAKVFFENLGIHIYVDWADKTMPETPNNITANKIKTQITYTNDKFILLATNNAVESKWCNWEVGIGDSFKLRKKKIAILPLADNRGVWNGNEYLQIYPRIEKSSIASNDFVVKYPDGTVESIATWLKRI